MGTSPLSPDEIRAAAGAHHQLGPEYSDAVVASFLEKVDQEIAARVEDRLAATSPRARPARPVEPKEPESRRTLLKGFALGVAASLFTVLLFAGARPGHHALLLVFPLAVAFAAGALWTSRRASRRAALRQSSPGAVSGGYRRLT
jgi:hypothetical protein